MKHMKKKLFQAAPVLVVAVLLVFWEAVVQIAQIPLYVLPAPSDMLKTFVTEFPVLAGHAGITVMEAFVGMGISFVVGVLIGILMDALQTSVSHDLPDFRIESSGHLQHQRRRGRGVDCLPEWSWLLPDSGKKWLYAG